LKILFLESPFKIKTYNQLHGESKNDFYCLFTGVTRYDIIFLLL